MSIQPTESVHLADSVTACRYLDVQIHLTNERLPQYDLVDGKKKN